MPETYPVSSAASLDAVSAASVSMLSAGLDSCVPAPQAVSAPANITIQIPTVNFLMLIPPFPFRHFTGKKLFYVPSCNIILILSQQCKRQNTRLSVSSPFSVPPALKNSAFLGNKKTAVRAVRYGGQ